MIINSVFHIELLIERMKKMKFSILTIIFAAIVLGIIAYFCQYAIVYLVKIIKYGKEYAQKCFSVDFYKFKFGKMTLKKNDDVQIRIRKDNEIYWIKGTILGLTKNNFINVITENKDIYMFLVSTLQEGDIQKI